jgi:hypothetical protein
MKQFGIATIELQHYIPGIGKFNPLKTEVRLITLLAERRKKMKLMIRRIMMLVAVGVFSHGCSSVQVLHHSIGIEPPLCKNGIEGSTVAVYWDTAWRQNQKEAQMREAIFAEGVENFFRDNGCVKTNKLSRIIGGKPVSMSTDDEITSDARAAGASKAIIMRVEELGPNLMLYLSPILWQTKNEVLLRVRVIDSDTGAITTDTSSHWYRGGPFMLLGTGSLAKDVRGVLEALFLDPRQ